MCHYSYSLYVWSIFIVLWSLGWDSGFLYPTYMNKSVSNKCYGIICIYTLLHIYIRNEHLYHSIRLDTAGCEDHATEGCSFFSQIRSHFTSLSCSWLCVWPGSVLSFFIHHTSSSRPLWKSRNSGCVGLVSFLNWHSVPLQKTLPCTELFGGTFMFNHLNVCIGFIIDWSWFWSVL